MSHPDEGAPLGDVNKMHADIVIAVGLLLHGSSAANKTAAEEALHEAINRLASFAQQQQDELVQVRQAPCAHAHVVAGSRFKWIGGAHNGEIGHVTRSDGQGRYWLSTGSYERWFLSATLLDPLCFERLQDVNPAVPS